jgi:hypothetical protein
MKHLDDASAVDLAEGRSNQQASMHAADCALCQELVARFVRLLDALEASTAPLERAPAHLTSWARACVRTLVQPSPRPRILELLAFGTQPIAAVRGGFVTGAAALFGDQDYQVDLQVEPSPTAGHHSLYGQIVPLAETKDQTWKVTVVTVEGRIYRLTTDRDGEFEIPDLESWDGLSMVAESDEERILIPRLRGGHAEGQT